MFAPLVINEKTVGIIDLANKVTDFSDNDARWQMDLVNWQPLHYRTVETWMKESPLSTTREGHHNPDMDIYDDDETQQ